MEHLLDSLYGSTEPRVPLHVQPRLRNYRNRRGQAAGAPRPFEEIFLNLETGYSPDNLSYASSCLWHLLASYRYIVQFRTIKRTRHTDFAQTAIAYMRSHLGERLTLDDIARSANYSPSHFGQLFLRHTGCTPLHYFNQLKIQRACQLLDFTDARIKEIAEQLGFFDQYHFTKAFVRYMGETPSRYRKHCSG